MFSSEKLDALTRNNKPSRVRRPTSVSQTLRAIREELDENTAPLQFYNESVRGSYRIVVASNRSTRERAYALAHDVYKRKGYVSETGRNLCVSPYDACAETLTLLAEDANGNNFGTVSVVFDNKASGQGLPCDAIYKPEVDALRLQGHRLAEVTRLAIAETCPAAKDVLMHLFHQAYIFARHVRGYTDLLAEVNPRHVAYYQRIIRFQEAGPERPCARVQDAPAVLLRLNLAEVEAAVLDAGCTQGRDQQGRRLVPYPYSKAEENAVVKFLARNHKPMSIGEAHYFELASITNVQHGTSAAAGQ